MKLYFIPSRRRTTRIVGFAHLIQTVLSIALYMQLLLLLAVSCRAFITPQQSFVKKIYRHDRNRTIRFKVDRLQRKESPTILKLSAVDISSSLNFDDISYTIQNIASSLASISLKDGDPSNLLTSLPIMYGAGLLTSASPCVWGLLPLTMSYISQAAGERADHKTTLPALAFAAGLATVFCTLGVAAVELGGVFGSSSSAGNGGIVLSVISSVVCLIMGLKLLDLINIHLPTFARDTFRSFTTATSGTRSSRVNVMGGGSRQGLILVDGTGRIMTAEEMKTAKMNQADSIDQQTTRKENGSLLRTFLLGGSSALVASPCATPVLTSILAYVASAANPGLGALLLLVYTAGYSTPLLIVAATGGQALENLRSRSTNANGESSNNLYSTIGPWVTPLTGGILLWYGTDGMLHALLGDPSLAGLTIL